MPELFGPIRQAAVARWESGSQRTCTSIAECYDESYECRWQHRATDDGPFSHISIFCSLADWSCNISDTLTDPRYDNLDLTDIDDQEVLARFFTRFLMVVAETFSDLEAIMNYCTGRRDARDLLSSSNRWVDRFHCFANRVCKHKFNNLHVCNHHIPLCFDDLADPCAFTTPICIAHLDIQNADALQFPSLIVVIDAVNFGYQTINQFFDDHPDAFDRLCQHFDETDPAPATP